MILLLNSDQLQIFKILEHFFLRRILPFVLPGVLQSRCARHDGRVQGGEGDIMIDEDDNDNFDDDSGKPLLSL